jgi:hypothetical protein
MFRVVQRAGGLPGMQVRLSNLTARAKDVERPTVRLESLTYDEILRIH